MWAGHSAKEFVTRTPKSFPNERRAMCDENWTGKEKVFVLTCPWACLFNGKIGNAMEALYMNS